MPVQLLKTTAELLKKQTDILEKSNRQQIEANSFQSAREMMNGDVSSAMDAFFLANPKALHEFNRAIHDDNVSNGTKKPLLNYSILGNEVRSIITNSDLDDESKQENLRSLDLATNFRASGDLDTVTAPGGANLLQTTVADYFLKTVEELGVVFNSGIDKRDMTNAGNMDQPVYDNFGRSQFVNAGTNYPDAGTDIEGNATKVTLNPRPFGNVLDVFVDFRQKLNAGWLKKVADILAERQAREKDFTVLFGTGSNPDYPTGMTNGAGVITGLTPGADEFETLGRYISRIAQLRRVSRNKMAVYINESINQRFIDLKYSMTNDDLSKMISLDSNGNISMIRGVKVITTEVSPVTSGTSTLVIGVPGLYLWGTAKADALIDDGGLTGFKSDSIAFKVSGMADGKPGFGNAFGKFDITGL